LKPGNVLPDFISPAKAGGNSWVRIQSYELEWCFRPFQNGYLKHHRALAQFPPRIVAGSNSIFL
ncbi:hypothetical protein, partial [Algoriphagus boritolerans]|uniref:hypothetical protein n=1 Tax=Algoriphagus boritolerans TaxID=308111 RepID=UPI002FCE21ED